MAGPFALKTQKALLTRFCNNLNNVISRYEGDISLQEDSFERLSLIACELKGTSKLVLEHLGKFANMVDALADSLTDEQEAQALDYMEKTQTAIDRAEMLIIQLDARNATSSERGQSAHFAGQRQQSGNAGQLEMAKATLPAIPIPTFNGKVWEYSNFWTLFDANVHSQPLSKLQKFNYLVNALRGEPRDLIRRFAVTDENYDNAVELLRKKYGNESQLIAILQTRLENTRAEQGTIAAQRKLLETLHPIVTQLEKLGVCLDGSFLAQKVLSKFTAKLQRKVLERQMSRERGEQDWKLQNIIAELDSLISMEERVNDMVSRNTSHVTVKEDEVQQRRNATRGSSNPTSCIFCGTIGHNSVNCRVYDTMEKRRKLMQERQLCLNCGRKDHYARDCTGEGCRNCPGRRHHYTICPKRFSKATSNKDLERGQASQQQSRTPSTVRKSEGTKQQRGKQTRAHPVSIAIPEENHEELEEAQEPRTILHAEEKGTLGRDGSVLLLTGSARIYNTASKEWTEVEILFDTGADQSFISASLASKLNLDSLGTESFQMFTFGSHEAKPAVCEMTQLELWDKEGKGHTVQLYTIPVLTEKGKKVILSGEDLKFLETHQIPLSTTNHVRESNPQILLGCDQLWDFLENVSPRFTLPSGLLLIPSKFGYLITGKQQMSETAAKKGRTACSTSLSTVRVFTNLSESLEEDRERWDKYWTIDSSGICEFTGTKNEEKIATQEKVENFFNSTIEKRTDGYYVRLPFKESHPPLPTNKAIAMKRLGRILEALKTDVNVLRNYADIIEEQKRKGIIEMVPDNQLQQGNHLHYIPHQPVITPHKETTKLRIVFDASSHFKNSPSLNDVLHQGPSILPELYGMLIRFRAAKYVATADVEKAFLQVHLNEIDRDATRFLWVRDINLPPEGDNIVTYRFTRVTFGLNVSPYLLAGTIRYHMQQQDTSETFASDIRDNLYVDNLILPADTEDELQQKAQASRRFFEDMGMNLREYLSNTHTLEKVLNKEICATKRIQKVLGVTWNADEDNLVINCTIPPSNSVTKRSIARQIASVYDPLGWLVPLMTKLKVFQQNLWKLPREWDDPIDTNLREEWVQLKMSVDGYENSIPRRLTLGTEPYHLAVFADASEIAMAVCAYLFNEQFSSLVMAKSKLPSINGRTTMPKMELNALTIAVRLANSIAKAIRERSKEFSRTIIILSDSQIALNWLMTNPYQDRAGVLVRNRTNEIRDIVSELEKQESHVQFKYVTTEENPADLGTRGTNSEGMDSDMWWHGPHFLRKPLAEWTNPNYMLYEEENRVKATALVSRKRPITNTSHQQPWDLSRFSNLRKAIRTVAIVLIFIKKLLRKHPEKCGKNIAELKEIQDAPIPITTQSKRAARRAIIRYHQEIHLTEEYRKSMENTLRLFKDHLQIWRSRGRLEMSSLKEEAKSPIIIAPKTVLANLIIREAHGTYHSGVEHTMANVRMQYWIPQLRQQVRHFIHDCVNCRRFNALPYQYPDSTDLPERRVQRGRPFQHIGLDFFDLPSIDENKSSKLYGCIFTCAATRLIHLELVASMSTEDFLNALRRFIARRGTPESITCDNAPTFLLSEQILKDDIAREITDQEIEWHHITPYAPWQGAFYERLIKSIKQSLYKAAREVIIRSYDQMVTIMAEIEACLNSRPLTYQEVRPDTLGMIRPIDFLQKDWVVTLPLRMNPMDDDPDYLLPTDLRALQTRRQVEEALTSSCKMLERFWKIWQQHYLTSLREKQIKNISKKRQGTEIPTVGSVVLVSDPVLPRNSWKLARITEIHQGVDGKIREVELTTNKRKIRRPVNLLVPLEIEEEDKPISQRAPVETVSDQKEKAYHRYDLRPRKQLQYVENALTNRKPIPIKNSRTKWFLFYVMILTILSPTTQERSHSIMFSCTRNGVFLHTVINESFQICADSYCRTQKSGAQSQMIRFPAEITLHDHVVMLKWKSGERTETISTICKGLNFCENVDCWFCSTILLNPECWPQGAIIILAILLYMIVAMVYALLYVPVTIGKPLRLILRGLQWLLLCGIKTVIHFCLWWIHKLSSKRRRTRSARMTIALAILLNLICATRMVTPTCQRVNIFDHKRTICTVTNGVRDCMITLSEVIKINALKREACINLVSNTSLITSIKIRWQGIKLHCDRQTLLFTRAVQLNVIDSKRCAHMGSCSKNKCADVNSSSLIPELEAGNALPGRTGCIESCGGWGCDCFYPSAGCLFYRVYAAPKSEKVYEVFRCMRWREEVKLEVTLERENKETTSQTFVRPLTPNVPVELPSLRIVMTSLALPPISLLNDRFITNGEDIAIWRDQEMIHLRCNSWEAAKTLNCTLHDDCRCEAAESKVKCQCSSSDLRRVFQDVETSLPIRTPIWQLENERGSLSARIPQMAMAEFIVDFKEKINNISLEVHNEVCTVANSILQGCYNCAQGAKAVITCNAKTQRLAEIYCEQDAFAVPCGPKTPQSTLIFALNAARQEMNCSVRCGTISRTFTLVGTLKYVNSLRGSLLATIQGNSTLYNEFQWPDFKHIFNTMFDWYKSILMAVLGVAVALLITYLTIQSLGLRMLFLITRLIRAILCCPLRGLVACIRFFRARKQGRLQALAQHQKIV